MRSFVSTVFVLVFAAFAVVALGACVAPPPGGAASPGTAPTSASAQNGTCEATCQHLVACGLTDDGASCVTTCRAEGHDGASLAVVESSSCEDIAAELAAQQQNTGGDGGGGGGGGGGIFSGEGSSCVGGSGGCSGVTICCGPSGPVAYGVQGVCRSSSICNMPRR